MTAAVNDHVDRDLLLGNDVAEDAALAFKDMVIGRDINTSNSETSSETLAVTRAQAKANHYYYLACNFVYCGTRCFGNSNFSGGSVHFAKTFN